MKNLNLTTSLPLVIVSTRVPLVVVVLASGTVFWGGTCPGCSKLVLARQEVKINKTEKKTRANNYFNSSFSSNRVEYSIIRMSDKPNLLPNPEVPSLFEGALAEGGRFSRKNKNVLKSHPVGKQWEKVESKQAVPLPESPNTKAKPKVIANLPGVNYKNLAPTLVMGGDAQDKKAEIAAADKTAKNLQVGKAAGSENKPALFAESESYFEKATTGQQNS